MSATMRPMRGGLNRTTLLIALLLSLVIMLATALVVTAARDPFSDKRGAPPNTTVVVLDQQVLERSVPALDAARRQRGLDLIASDSRLRFLNLPAARAVEQAAWTTGSGELLGAVITIRLPRPVEIDGEWLGLTYDPEERAAPPYQSVPYRATHRSVSAIIVFVDLQRGEIAGFAPDPDAELVGEPLVPAGVETPSRPRD